MQELLESLLEQGIPRQQAELMARYGERVVQANEKFNLTRILSPADMAKSHFVDSIDAARRGYIDSRAQIIDIGTGAGFPGVPVKIADPSVKMTLLDSLNKRITFLNELTKKLELDNVDCIHMRAEDGGSDKKLRESFDMCVSRAVANLAVLCEYCLPFVKVGGQFISMKGPDVSEEIAEAEKAVKVLGGEITEVKKAIIPETDITHSLIIIKKVKPTPSKYPRKAGKAKKEPII